MTAFLTAFVPMFFLILALAIPMAGIRVIERKFS